VQGIGGLLTRAGPNHAASSHPRKLQFNIQAFAHDEVGNRALEDLGVHKGFENRNMKDRRVEPGSFYVHDGNNNLENRPGK
jgi:hypothetical protein